MTTWLHHLTQRNIILLLLAGQTLLFGEISLALWREGGFSISTVTGLTVALVFVLLTYTYACGWETARFVAVVVVTVALSLASDASSFGMSLLIAPVLALILTNLWWVAGSAVIVWLGIALRSGGQGEALSAANAGIYMAIVGGLLLSRLMLENTLRIARENAAQAEESRVAAEAERQQVARSASELAAQNEQQGKLLDLVTTLETPAISLAEGVLLAPIVGALDSRRIQSLTTRLLEQVSRQRTHLVVLDIAGVAAVDTTAAKGLVQVAQGLRLLGCEVTITGISASVASSLSSAGVNLAGVQTTRSPHEALSILTRMNN